MPRIFTLLILVFATLTVRAQMWEIGGIAGAAGYMGDLNQREPFKVSGAAFGAYIQRNYGGYLSVKATYMHGRIQGADSTSSDAINRARNLSFATNLDEVAAVVQFHFLEFRPGIDRHAFAPYIFLGIGAVGFNPTAKYNGQTYDLQPLMTEGETKPYSKVALTIPYGAGIKYNFKKSLSLAFDLGYRNPSTDYLDDVSGNYADKTKFTNPVAVALSDRTGEKTGVYTGVAGTQRGDGRSHDSYFFMSLSISFTFISDKCFFQY